MSYHVYVEVFEEILFIEKIFGTLLREMSIRRTITVFLGFSVLIWGVPATYARPAEGHRMEWRFRRLPRIELPPHPRQISILPDRSGWAHVIGTGLDSRAQMVRIINLCTADQVAALVRPDGSFETQVFAPPGSWLQINVNMLPIEDLGPELEKAMRRHGFISPSDMPHIEIFDGMIGSHLTSSPGIIIPVLSERAFAKKSSAFVKKVGLDLWMLGSARTSTTQVVPGDTIDLEITLSVVFGPKAESRRTPRKRPMFGPSLHRLFDRDGRQRSPSRQPISDVLTPTGLPIETHGEVVAEPRPDGRKEWNLGGTGLPVPWHFRDPGRWQVEGGRPTIKQRLKVEIPREIPAGFYQLESAIWGVGEEEFDTGEPVGGPLCLCYLRIGNPAPPRLTCLLLGSAGTGGARGTVAREDRGHFAINTKIVVTPDKLIIPRDDIYTKKPRTYPLDPYVPTLSMAHRPAPVIPRPRIPFDFAGSNLTVTVTTPSGETETLGPAPLLAGQNDLSVLRPDYVFPDRIMPPVPPTYGNPSASDMYHLSGRGAFDYAFKQYGHYQVKLKGRIKDMMGTTYSISGTYDVHVARSLDIDIFPEPGTPLEPGVDLHPQVRIMPAMPAQVEIRWHHFPYSDATRAVEKKTLGKANRWGIFVPGPHQPKVNFKNPGEYICDVTVHHKDEDGTLWMASRRGASVVVTSDSKVVVHGERGNRSPTARWRARWFLAGDGRFVAPPPPSQAPPELPPDTSPAERLERVDLGHTCLPYEPGDVAWLGSRMNFSLFPGLTFEDPEGTISNLIEQRWPAVRQGAGREGLYPYELKPEDRRAIGEMPYVCMTASGIPPSISPNDIDQWGYFYTTSWRPGVAVRSLVAEDAQPVGYWFFDDPYAYQFGNGPQGDLPGDVKMNYGAGVFRDKTSGVTHYGGYASMLVLIDAGDPLGARVLPPFNGVVPSSPLCGPLLQIGGEKYDVFLTFGAVAPGAVLEVGDRLSIAGVVWPPVSGYVEGKIIKPSGKQKQYKRRSDSMGVFDYAGQVVDEPGVWRISAEGFCTGKTSVGTISELVRREKWPRGSGIGLSDSTFPLPVVPKDSRPIAFDLPTGSRARPPLPFVIRGHSPPAATAEKVNVLVSLPGQVVDQQVLPLNNHTFEYVYDPRELRKLFPNIDTMIERPEGGFEHTSAWFDTVIFTFWAGRREELTAGMVLLQGEEIYAQTNTGSRMPLVPKAGLRLAGRKLAEPPLPSPDRVDKPSGRGDHSSLLILSSSGSMLFAAHPWSGEIVRLDVRGTKPSLVAKAHTGGEPRSVTISPDNTRLYAALADKSQIVVLDAISLRETARFDVGGRPRAVLPSADGKGLFVADFDGDRVVRLEAATGRLQAKSPYINRPACLALSPDGSELFTVGFRTGQIVVLDKQCVILRRLAASPQLNQCYSITPGPGGLLHAPQTRSDTVTGGVTFDRSVFPAIVVADPRSSRTSIKYFPDLLVVPPHRPVEVAVDKGTVYLASAGSDDVLAIDRSTGFAKWHTQRVGLEPGGIVLDASRMRLYVLTITGQQIVSLDARTGDVLSRMRFTHDPTPQKIARGRYLFGTATDKRLTKDQWMSCAVCHPDGGQDGRQWNFGSGPLDTTSLRGCLQTSPLHITGHLDEIQDTYDFTRLVMAGQWFVPRQVMHEYLGESNAGLDPDLDALAAYIASLPRRKPPEPPTELVAVIERGRDIFFSKKTGCSSCHPPPLYTDSGKYTDEGRFVLHDVGTYLPSDRKQYQQLDTPSLIGLCRSEPYLHDGRARTLEEIFTKFNPEDRHGQTSHLSKEEIHALVEFLRFLK
jgi:DNA-binding beta-propeller fold protein YncE